MYYNDTELTKQKATINMNFKAASLTIIGIIILVGGVLLIKPTQQAPQNSGTSTSTTATTQNCSVYTAQQGSEFRPNSLPQIENRQALKRATIDYHGEDMEGKDGELATVGFNLALLYHEYQAHQCANPNTEFTSDQSQFDNTGGSITIEGSARDGMGERLADRLRSLGADRVAGSKNGVSAIIPIEKIPHVAKIKAASSLWSSQGTTNSESTGAMTN